MNVIYCAFSLAEDFDAIAKEVIFAAGANQSYCFNVSVRPDKFVERTEQFSLLLSSNSERVTIAPNRARFTIVDEDGKYVGWHTFLSDVHILLQPLQLFALPLRLTLHEDTSAGLRHSLKSLQRRDASKERPVDSAPRQEYGENQ